MNPITTEYIKQRLEEVSGVVDIGTKDRVRHISDLRKTYCFLSKTFTSKTLFQIGQTLRKDFTHHDVLYNINKFIELYETEDLSCIDVYQTINNEISKSITPVIELNTIDGVKRAYNSKMAKAVNKFFIAIDKRDSKIAKLEKENKRLKRNMNEFNKLIFRNI